MQRIVASVLSEKGEKLLEDVTTDLARIVTTPITRG